MAAEGEILFRDSRDIQPPASAYEAASGSIYENIYEQLEPAKYIACQEDIWRPADKVEEEGGVAEIKMKSAFTLAVERLQARCTRVLDHKLMLLLVFLMTVWALFVDDILYAWPLSKSLDKPAAIVTAIFFGIFNLEWIARSFAQYSECVPRKQQPQQPGTLTTTTSSTCPSHASTLPLHTPPLQVLLLLFLADGAVSQRVDGPLLWSVARRSREPLLRCGGATHTTHAQPRTATRGHTAATAATQATPKGAASLYTHSLSPPSTSCRLVQHRRLFSIVGGRHAPRAHHEIAARDQGNPGLRPVLEAAQRRE